MCKYSVYVHKNGDPWTCANCSYRQIASLHDLRSCVSVVDSEAVGYSECHCRGARFLGEVRRYSQAYPGRSDRYALALPASGFWIRKRRRWRRSNRGDNIFNLFSTLCIAKLVEPNRSIESFWAQNVRICKILQNRFKLLVKLRQICYPPHVKQSLQLCLSNMRADSVCIHDRDRANKLPVVLE